MSGDRLVGGTTLAGGSVVIVQPAAHGQVRLSPDGSFTYTPEAGFIGKDSFWVARADAPSSAVGLEVVIRVLPVTASLSSDPAATAAASSQVDALMVGSTMPGGPSGPVVSFGSLGPLDFAFDWLIPGFAVAVPGLLLVLLVIAQAAIGTAWLPLVRREIGDFGLRAERRRKRAVL